MRFIIIFDIPENMRVLARRVQRRLNKAKAEMIQQSVWRCDNFQYWLK